MFLAFQSQLVSFFLSETPGVQSGQRHCNNVFSQLLSSTCPPATSSLYPNEVLHVTTWLLENSLSVALHTSLQSSLSTCFSSPCVPPNTLHKVLKSPVGCLLFTQSLVRMPGSVSQTLESKHLGLPHRPWEEEKERQR